MLKRDRIKQETGAMLVMALVFTTLFTVMAIGIAGMISAQHKYGLKKINWAKSLAAAEAGINYYRWHLAHAPEDYADGTGAAGPYVHDYQDNLGNPIGQFSLNITPPSACSNVVLIESTGLMNNDPNVTRSVKVKYGKKSLADYAFLTNSNAWFGDTEALHGPVHSNGGIRMDGSHDSLVTSAKETYLCGPEHGCSYQNKPGVWGSGGDPELWDYPVSNVDFDAITTDLQVLKNLADNTACSASEDCLFPQQGLGYHLRFINNGTFDLYRVTRLTNPTWGYNGSGWIRESNDLLRESLIGNYNIPSNCGIIFVEDNLWIDGAVKGKVTVVAAKLPESGNTPKIIINGNLTYAAKDGTNVLGIISQSDIIVPLWSAPDNLEVDAALMAQKGHVYRKYYCRGLACQRWVDGLEVPFLIRNSITIYGSIITNTVWTWSWVNGSGQTVSGYRNTITNYDPNLTYNPPPGFPTTGEHEFLQWEETTEKQ